MARIQFTIAAPVAKRCCCPAAVVGPFSNCRPLLGAPRSSTVSLYLACKKFIEIKGERPGARPRDKRKCEERRPSIGQDCRGGTEIRSCLAPAPFSIRDGPRYSLVRKVSKILAGGAHRQGTRRSRLDDGRAVVQFYTMASSRKQASLHFSILFTSRFFESMSNSCRSNGRESRSNHNSAVFLRHSKNLLRRCKASSAHLAASEA